MTAMTESESLELLTRLARHVQPEMHSYDVGLGIGDPAADVTRANGLYFGAVGILTRETSEGANQLLAECELWMTTDISSGWIDLGACGATLGEGQYEDEGDPAIAVSGGQDVEVGGELRSFVGILGAFASARSVTVTGEGSDLVTLDGVAGGYFCCALIVPTALDRYAVRANR